MNPILASRKPAKFPANRLSVEQLNNDQVAGLARYMAVQPAAAVTGSVLNRFIQRAGFGPAWGQAEEAASLGFSAYLEQQLDYKKINDKEADKAVKKFKLYSKSLNKLLKEDWWKLYLDLAGATIARARYSKRQLFERMVEFWSDHFNVYVWANAPNMPALKIVEDRDVIRKYALATFRELLTASVKSPAMLFYLDNVPNNVTNESDEAQENYARELLELHALGVTSGYTQTDVHEVARILTGWGAYDWGKKAGTFRFDAEAHDQGEKNALGHYFPPGGGEQEVYELIDILIAHPATPSFLASKLIRHFLSDSPPAGLVSQVAAAYGTDGDIKAMLRALFNSGEFQELGSHPKLKRPFAWMISQLRGLNVPVDPTATDTLLWNLSLMGHSPFEWPAPNGYPNVAGAWMNNLLPRWNFSLALAFGWHGGKLKIPWKNIYGKAGGSATEQVLDWIALQLFGQPLDTALRSATIDYVNAAQSAGETEVRRAEAVSVMIDSPQFHWT